MNKALIARRFSAAAASYGDGAALQQAAAQRLLAALADFPPGERLLDLGCGTGAHLSALANHGRQLLAVDLAPEMVAHARMRGVEALVADAEQLPLADGSFDRIFSNLMVQWLADLNQVLAEVKRLLAPGGVAVISTLAAGTLGELGEAFAAVDGRPHINRFLPLAEIEAQAVAAGFGHSRVTLHPFVSHYPDVQALLHELKNLGANTLLGESYHRPLTRRRLQAMSEHYQQQFAEQGRLPARWQIVTLILEL